MKSLLPSLFKTPLKYNNKNFRTKETNKYFDSKENELSRFKINQLSYVKKCVACKKNKQSILIKKSIFKYLCCKNCNHVYLLNPIKKKKIENLYRHSKEDKLSRLRKNKRSPYSKYFILVYKKYLKIICHYVPKKSNLLDLGCGDGSFIQFLKKKKYFNLFANEIASSEESKLKNILGNNFFNKSIEKINFKKNFFHAVTMWGVLEHVTDVDLTFRNIKKILHQKGILFFWIPNINSYAFKLLKEKTPAVSPRDHLNFFSYKSVEYLCKRHKFKIINFFQECPVIDLMYPLIKVNQRLINNIIKKNQCYYHVYILQKN